MSTPLEAFEFYQPEEEESLILLDSEWRERHLRFKEIATVHAIDELFGHISNRKELV